MTGYDLWFSASWSITMNIVLNQLYMGYIVSFYSLQRILDGRDILKAFGLLQDLPLNELKVNGLTSIQLRTDRR